MKSKINLLISTLLLSGILTYAATAPPVITLAPQSVVVSVGTTVVLTVLAAGNNLQYQWTLNGDILPGATTSILTLSNVTQDIAGGYQVIVRNTDGEVRSAVADVLVIAPALPFADNFASRGTINAASGLGTGSSHGATKEPGEPKPGNLSTGSSVWLTWIAPANGIATFSTMGSTFDTVLGVYTGTTVSTLVEVASDDDSGDYHTSYVTFNATAGTAYQIYVGSLGNDGDAILLGWNLNTPIIALPTITSRPKDITTVSGAAASMCVQYQSTATLGIQWYHNGQPIPGANQTCLNWSQLTVADLGAYQVSLSSPDWTWDLDPVEIQFNSEGLTTVGARNKLSDSITSPLIGK